MDIRSNVGPQQALVDGRVWQASIATENPLLEMNDTSDTGESLNSADGLFLSVSSICLLVVEILGVLCNSVILAIYYKYSRLRTATNLLIFNLALCHLLLATLELVLSLPSSFGRGWLYGSSGCVAYGFVYHYLMSVEVCSLSVISFDRFCVITKPVRNLRIFILTKTHVRLLVLAIHLYALVFTLPPLVGWNEYVPDRSYQTGCYVNYADRSASSLAYTIVLTAFTCVLPFALTVCCYARIYQSVRDSSKRSTLNAKATQKASRGEASGRTNHSRSRRSLTHTRTARMIAVVMLSFLLTWLPFKVTGLCQAFGVAVSSLTVHVCAFLAKSCVMYNAVVYVILNHRFRAAFLHLTFLCRDENIRLTTSAANQSGRFGAEILGHTDKYKPRGMAGKKLSQLSIISVGLNPDASSICGKTSADVPTDMEGSSGTSAGLHEDVGSKRFGSISRVNEALEVDESERRARDTPTVPEEHPSTTEETTTAGNYGSDIRDLSHREQSPVVVSGAYCQESNIVLSDEESDDERFIELNVSSLSDMCRV